MNTYETELIRKLSAGDENSFKQLFDQYKTLVFNTAAGFLTNEKEAEDITQEVFIQVFRSIKQFEERSKISTWIYRITITKCLDELRKKKTRKRFAFFTNLLDKDDDTGKELFVDYEHPGVDLDKKELSKILFKEIEKLPENQRIAFVLNKVEHLGYTEISEVMGTSVSSVESLIFRARSNLKKNLEKYFRS